MYVTDRRQTDVRRASSLNAPYPKAGGIITAEEQRKPGMGLFLERGGI